MKEAFDFKKQLSKGDEGEAWFKENYHAGPLEIIKENYADFKRPDGKILELKTDFYDPEQSPNFFFERYSDYEKKSPGSVWQSLNKADIFVYMFFKTKVYYEFEDIAKVIEELDEITKKLKWIAIRNKGWTASGYKIPRDSIKHLYTVYGENKKGT